MRILHSIWLNEAKAWPVGDYLLMPDRMHFFCGLRDSRVTVEHWIAYWKDRFAKGHSQRTWVWQRGAFHHRVRSIREYREKWTYMMTNPMRKGLVTQWEDWPWRGELTISRGRTNRSGRGAPGPYLIKANSAGTNVGGSTSLLPTQSPPNSPLHRRVAVIIRPMKFKGFDWR